MSEKETIREKVGTIQSLVADLRRVGVEPGMTLLVHSSLSSLGWVCGGAVAVILGLERALGPRGTLMMPAHSGDLSDPAEWQNPPVPSAWWEIIRETMPPYDPDLTPTRGIGVIPELFRTQRGVLRSGHPQLSFAAYGPQAAAIVDRHTLAYSLGEQSPLARLYDLDGRVLLLGVDHSRNSSLHLAEYRADFPGKREVQSGAPVLVEGERQWVTFPDIDLNADDFARLGRDFTAESGLVWQGRVAYAAAALMPQRALVDYAVHWLARNR